MADFFQNGSMATLHRLGRPDLERIEDELTEFSRHRRIALVLPCHVKELGSAALRGILQTLKAVRYIDQIVVGIDGASSVTWQRARRIFAGLPQETALLWNDGPRLRGLIEILAKNGLDPGPGGKGRNIWLCFGHVLAGGRSQMVAVHDCDILTYDRELLARLCYPVAHPTLGFDFCKGFSARFTDRLNGRVMRLLFTPLVRSLQSILGEHPFLSYLDTFRYPLSGEVSMDCEILRRARVPCDWGVEIGMLAEVFRVCSLKSVCQVDIADCYDHKHRKVSARSTGKGLSRMAVDIVKCVFRTLASHGVKLDRGTFDTLLSAFLRKAEDAMRFYAADAEINGLKYDRPEEEAAVLTFARSIRAAASAYLQNPLDDPLIPNWNRVEADLPEFFRIFSQAIAADNQR